MTRNQISQEHSRSELTGLSKALDSERPRARMRVAGSEVRNPTNFLVGKNLSFSWTYLLPSVPSIGFFGINCLQVLLVFNLISLHRNFHKSKYPGCHESQYSLAIKAHERFSTNNCWVKDSNSLLKDRAFYGSTSQDRVEHVVNNEGCWLIDYPLDYGKTDLSAVVGRPPSDSYSFCAVTSFSTGNLI